MISARKRLYDLVLKWEGAATGDRRDVYPFRATLDDILYEADLRYGDYVQYTTDGDFPSRMFEWLGNVPEDRLTVALFRLLSWLVFVDRWQMRALHRDAYRRIIVPWITERKLSVGDLLAPDYHFKVHSLLKRYLLLSVTQSFGFDDFLHANDLSGLAKPLVLGEHRVQVWPRLRPYVRKQLGAIVMEDFVGTGNQAGGVLAEIRRRVPKHWRILFAPLIILEKGADNIRSDCGALEIELKPALVIPYSCCIDQHPKQGESNEIRTIRALVASTAPKVLQSMGAHDDPPRNAYGYGGCGAMVVTCHNTPNNTLPLVHHRSPSWIPLFRRVHHSKDGLR